MAAARPQVTVQSITKGEKSSKQVAMPSVFLAPIRPDVVHYVHVRMAKNGRQPYAVNEDAGMQHSAHSWGTGRAVARIPRVSGSGTSRAGQAAFGNMCRKGRMFAPTKTWRKWHYRINVNQKRFAVASALAASAVPALVMARGHHVHRLPEVPLVLDDKVESLTKTKDAIAALRLVGAFSDVEKAKRSLKLRAGKGKGRARRYTQRKGPLVVYAKDNGVTRAFRNLPGVELCHVNSLNLLQLAPGSHLGRFIIWSQSAFKRLDLLWGKNGGMSTFKKGYHLPHNIMTNSDISRIINSDEVQSKVRPAITHVPRYKLKKNPLKNLGVMYKLNPYALHSRRAELHHQRKVALVKRNRAVQLAKTGKRVASTKDRRIRKAKKAHREQKRKTFARISAE